MEPVTHFLTGAVLARSGFTRKTALATATMVIAAEAPDIDILWYAGGSAVGFVHHRGFTHTLIGIPVIAALVVGLMYLWNRWYTRAVPRNMHRPAGEAPPVPVRWKLLFGLACLAGYSHLLLDFTNNYGIRPFWPFSQNWYSWDIVFIVDPVILVVLIAGLVLPSLFALVNDEIGARGKGPRGRGGAITALVLLALIWGVRDYEHRRALNAMESLQYQGQNANRLSAYPYHSNPFKWHGVLETDEFYETVQVDSLRPEVDPNGRSLVFYKPQDSDVIHAVRESYLGRTYFQWAAYPLVETEKRESPQSGYIVRVRDLRFAYPDLRNTPLAAYWVLDDKLDVLRAGFRSASPLRDRLQSDTPSVNGNSR
jgi:inner membrane protein